MQEKHFTLFLSIAVGLTVVLGRCSPVPASSEAMSPTPEKVVESFYNWYAGYPGNLLVNGAYRSSKYLTADFVRKVDKIITSFDKGSYDPFLCAQDKPGSFAVDKAFVSGEEASIIMHQIWNAGTQYELNHDVTVVLRMVNGQWKIAGIVCNASPPVTPSARTTALPPALGLQTLSGQGFVLRYPANARVEDYEDHLRILGPEIGVRPADADWGWIGWAYEMDIGIFDNPDGLSAAAWARQYILSQWREAQAAGEPFTGPVVNDQINEDAVAEVSVGGLAAFQADWFGGDSIRRAIYVTDGKRMISFILNLYPVENNPIAKVQEDIYALMLNTFHFSEEP